MDVRFEKITHLGSRCFRYVPFLDEKLWTNELREFYSNSSRRDLAVFPVDDYWRYFLNFYTLTRIEESQTDAWVKFYQLKPGIDAQLPKKLALIYATPQTEVKFDSHATVLESKPTPGRMSEFVLLEGSFSFNEGSFFDPFWMSYSL